MQAVDRGAVAVAVAVGLLLAGCATAAQVAEPGGQEQPVRPGTARATADDAPTPTPTAGVSEHASLIATARVDVVEAREAPDPGADVVHRLAHPTARGAPRVFLVERRRGAWFEVQLPVRPNGTTGWVRAEDVELSRTGLAVEVDLGDFELRVTREGEELVTSPIGYGAEDTPTPGGRYFITELLRPPDPDGVYGSYAFGLSGFSDVLLSFAGGEGVIGIHGTNDPDSIGRRVSAGCIRVPDDVIVELAGLLPLGTPVTITG